MNLNIRNPPWEKFVRSVTGKAAVDLGIKLDAGAVKAKLLRVGGWRLPTAV